MRILLLTQVVPYPPDSGPKVKTYHVLRHLARRHEVHLVSFVRSQREAVHAEALRPFCAGIAPVPLRRSSVRDAFYLTRSLVRGRPFLVERDDSRTMRATVARRIAEVSFDAIHADQLSMAQFAVDLVGPMRVLDEHNAVWTIVRRSAGHERWGPRRLLAELEWRKLRRYEGEVCRRFDHVTVVSDRDRAALEEAAGAALPATVIPIAVDPRELASVRPAQDAPHIVSVATMFYPPNAEGICWFATEVFPLIRASLPETQFYVVGSRPPERVTRLGYDGSGVVVTGYVEDLQPILRKSGALVVPVHSGSGMRVKILEAFARGIPVVSTSVGVEGIQARAGEHLLVADDPGEFAAAVLRVLTQPATASKLARAGRALVEARYDWRNALVGLDNVYGPGRLSLRPRPTALSGGNYGHSFNSVSDH